MLNQNTSQLGKVDQSGTLASEPETESPLSNSLDLTVRVARRIQVLTRERDEFIAQANQRVAAYNGGIGELNHLLNTALAVSPAAPSSAPVDNPIETGAGAAETYTVEAVTTVAVGPA